LDIWLDGSLKTVANLRSNICYLTCWRHLIRPRAMSNQIYFLRKKTYFPSCVRNICWVTISYKFHGFQLTGWTVYYRKSVLHLPKRTWNIRLSRCSTDLRFYMKCSVQEFKLQPTAKPIEGNCTIDTKQAQIYSHKTILSRVSITMKCTAGTQA